MSTDNMPPSEDEVRKINEAWDGAPQLFRYPSTRPSLKKNRQVRLNERAAAIAASLARNQ
jgi:hypothetical protein